MWIATGNNSMSTTLLTSIFLLSKVGSELSIASTFLSETVDKLTSEVDVPTNSLSSLLLALFTRQFLSFSCLFTVFAALSTLLFTISSFLCLNLLSYFCFFPLIVCFLTLQDFTIFSLIMQLYNFLKLQFWNEIFFLDKPNICSILHNLLRKLLRNIIQFYYQPFLLSFKLEIVVFWWNFLFLWRC